MPSKVRRTSAIAGDNCKVSVLRARPDLMLCSVPWSVVHTGFLCEVKFINELRIMAGSGWVLVKVGPGVHVGVVGHREVVGAIAGSGRWADAGDHVGQKGEALQAGGSMPAWLPGPLGTVTPPTEAVSQCLAAVSDTWYQIRGNGFSPKKP